MEGIVVGVDSNLTFAILGGGNRGSTFSDWIRTHPEFGKAVAVAEPVAARRDEIARQHGIGPELRFERWEDLLARPPLADVVINTTMDRLHAPSAVLALKKGYHMLLEKPMATTLEECVAIDRARRENGRIVSICHSLRYHVVYSEIKRLLDSGAIGRLVSFDQMEAVGHIHHSHSYVRGNWGNESRSTFMLMSKSCHDVDILAYLVGRPCKRVSSFGERSLFNEENAPSGAPVRCVDGCPAERDCVYSAHKVYLGPEPSFGAWGAQYVGVAGKPYEEQVEILRTSPYGRCAFRTDNDVVDHQVVSFEFEGGVSGTFTMTAFTPFGGRYVRLHGTRGYISANTDGNTIDLHRFADGAHDRIQIPPKPGGHGGADDTVMRNFVQAVIANDPGSILTSTAESLASHKIVFAAEIARREKRVVEISELGV
jgi:predicted dehydrogenase